MRLRTVVFALVGVFSASEVFGQPKNDRRLENEIRVAWQGLCEDVGDQEPWQTHIDKLEPLVARAKDIEQGAMLRDYLDAMILARDYEVPEGVTVLNATPDQLIEMLSVSRLFGPTQKEFILITRPLQWVRDVGLYWGQMADRPAHEFLDPAIATYHRGRDIIPQLIDALDDMTATRSWYQPSSTKYWTVLVRRADFAMAILEAVTRIKFSPPDVGHGFSHQPKEKRDEIIAHVEEWWEHNQHASPLEARIWALERADVLESFWMLNVLGFEKQTGIVVEHLHRLLDRDLSDDYLRDVARRLANLGDNSGIRLVSQKVATSITPKINELRLLAAYGERKDFEMLARRYSEGLTPDKNKKQGQQSSVSKSILAAVEQAKTPMAVIVFARALFNGDNLVPWPVNSKRRPHNWSSVDIAAENIQKLTGRDFGYFPHLKTALRRLAIERIRDWWRVHGEKHHQAVSATDGRSDAIR